MWLEINDKVIDLPGILILEDNPITIGAYSVLPTLNRFVAWIHKKRYTASFLKGLTLVNKKCTFSITDDWNLIDYCGHISGRMENKLGKVPTVVTDGYRYVSDSVYVILLSSEDIFLIHDFYLVIFSVDKVLNFRGGNQWINCPP